MSVEAFDGVPAARTRPELRQLGAPFAEARVLVVDNYDSFTFNLVQYFLELGAHVEVVRNDALDADAILARKPTHLVLSPGPGGPQDSGVCQELSRRLLSPAEEGGLQDLPTLGVCLGHQTLCALSGAKVERAPVIMHGKTSEIEHDGQGLFEGLERPLQVTRYHSLVVPEPSLPDCWVVTSRAPGSNEPDAGSTQVMGVRHRERPVFGVQFHPESIASRGGHAMLARFLGQTAGAADA